jgi:hypothetical protein
MNSAMTSYGTLSKNLWTALRDLQEGQIDLHPRTAEALMSRGLARRVSKLQNGRVVCQVTKKGKKFGLYYPKK